MREIKHLSIHQWIRFAIPDSQQPTSPIGFLFLKLPPPPCAVLLVSLIYTNIICVLENVGTPPICGHFIGNKITIDLGYLWIPHFQTDPYLLGYDNSWESVFRERQWIQLEFVSK